VPLPAYLHNYNVMSRGFTLIELLIVIAIIGVLSSIILTNINNARAAARDASRISDLRNMRNAMEIFYTTNGRYPNQTDVDIVWDIGNEGNPSDPFISELETGGIFSRTPREKWLSTDAPPQYGYTYLYRKLGAGTPCNNGKPFAIFVVVFEKTQPNFSTDDIDSCGCNSSYAGDTCLTSRRYGIMFRE